MKEIYIIRHGETEFNKKGIVQGSGVDADLNETGQRQAEAFYKQFGHVPFHKIYTSKLKRTRQSVAQFLHTIPHESHHGLNEISWGKYEGQNVSAEEKAAFNELIAQWKIGNHHLAVEGGESPETVMERQRSFLPWLLERDHEEKVLVCMHGRAMRIFLCLLLDVPLSEMDRFGHQNLGLYLLKMDKNQKFTLALENFTGHLDSL